MGGDFALRFFDRVQTVVADASNVAIGSDFQFSRTTGPKSFATDLMNRYFTRLNRKVQTDGRLADAFNRVVIMEARPNSLFRPGIMWRVLKPGF